jgi:glycosyltransferase involved in cell wall biosynthesis
LIRVSVIVPNYNSGAVLERCLGSLRRQNYEGLEVIVVDSLSSDASASVISINRSWLSQVISEKDAGQADGLNKGFRLATGEIFAWLCADDELAPSTLHHVEAIFRDHPDTDVVMGSCERRFPDGTTAITPARTDAWRQIGIQNVVDQPSMFWRSSLHQKLGELNTSFRLAFDWDFWCRMRDAGARLRITEQVLSIYYFTGDNQSGKAGRRHAEESFRILRRYGPCSGLLAYAFRFLYCEFDLKGCYDQPPTCTVARARLFGATLVVFRLLFGKRLLYSYNWHFASCQERNLKWW